MKAIAQFVVHVFDLIEAEGASLLTVVRREAGTMRDATTNMAMGVTALLVSVPLFVCGIGMIAAGLMWWLETQISRPLAACLTGLFVLMFGGACVVCFKWLVWRHEP